MNAAWDRAFPDCLHDDGGRRMATSLKWGLRAMATLPWAQDIGPNPSTDQLHEVMNSPAQALIVLDLPPKMAPPQDLPQGAWSVARRPRQSTLTHGTDPIESWPSTRKKQLKRAEREGMTAHRCTDIPLLVKLHQTARERKGLTSDEHALQLLLTELLQEPDTHGWTIQHANGKVLAGGVFHGDGDRRCIYGFGGQFRSEAPGESSRATVLLIAAAMREAVKQGNHTFDFGGSMDAGVDRFYAEFGASKVAKHRLVRVAPRWRLLLKWRRPDLFKP